MSATEVGTRQLVVFSLATERYALPIESVREIIRWTPPRSVASDRPGVEGVISLRGQIVPVCALARQLGVDADRGSDAKIVVVEDGDAVAGVIVDEVEEVLTVEDAAIDQVPGGGSDLLAGIVRAAERLLVIVDPAVLVGALT